MTADLVAWIVLVVSTFYLLDRLMVWALSRALASYGRRAGTSQASGRGTVGSPPEPDVHRGERAPGDAGGSG